MCTKNLNNDTILNYLLLRNDRLVLIGDNNTIGSNPISRTINHM